jgi:hypothetical protein
MKRALLLLLLTTTAAAQQQPDVAKLLESERTRTDRQTEDTHRVSARPNRSSNTEVPG